MKPNVWPSPEVMHVHNRKHWSVMGNWSPGWDETAEHLRTEHGFTNRDIAGRSLEELLTMHDATHEREETMGKRKQMRRRPRPVTVAGDISLGPICVPVPQVVLDAANTVDAPVKAFLCTPVGKIVGFGLSSGLTQGLSSIVGAQLATVAFAVPGILEGQNFPKAWLDQFNERLAMLPGALAAAGGSPGAPSAQDIQKLIGDQVQQAAQFLSKLPPGTLQMGAAQLAQTLGIRQDAAQYALDLFYHTAPGTAGSIYDPNAQYNPATGALIMPGTQQASSVQQANMLFAALNAQKGVVGRAGQQFISQGSAKGMIPGVTHPSPTAALPPSARSVPVWTAGGAAAGAGLAVAAGLGGPVFAGAIIIGAGIGYLFSK